MHVKDTSYHVLSVSACSGHDNFFITHPKRLLVLGFFRNWHAPLSSEHGTCQTNSLDQIRALAFIFKSLERFARVPSSLGRGLRKKRRSLQT